MWLTGRNKERGLSLSAPFPPSERLWGALVDFLPLKRRPTGGQRVTDMQLPLPLRAGSLCCAALALRWTCVEFDERTAHGWGVGGGGAVGAVGGCPRRNGPRESEESEASEAEEVLLSEPSVEQS